MKKRFTYEHVIAVLREAETGTVPIKALCRKHNISEPTFSRWRKHAECARSGAVAPAAPSTLGGGAVEQSAVFLQPSLARHD